MESCCLTRGDGRQSRPTKIPDQFWNDSCHGDGWCSGSEHQQSTNKDFQFGSNQSWPEVSSLLPLVCCVTVALPSFCCFSSCCWLTDCHPCMQTCIPDDSDRSGIQDSEKSQGCSKKEKEPAERARNPAKDVSFHFFLWSRFTTVHAARTQDSGESNRDQLLKRSKRRLITEHAVIRTSKLRLLL